METLNVLLPVIGANLVLLANIGHELLGWSTVDVLRTRSRLPALRFFLLLSYDLHQGNGRIDPRRPR